MSALFNGLVVDSLNDSTGFGLSGVTVSTNMVGWSDDRISYDIDTVLFNWSTLDFTVDIYFDVQLDFGGGAPVPEPSTLLLLGSGLVGMVGWNRKKWFKKDQ